MKISQQNTESNQSIPTESGNSLFPKKEKRKTQLSSIISTLLLNSPTRFKLTSKPKSTTKPNLTTKHNPHHQTYNQTHHFILNQLPFIAYITLITIVGFTESANADWFKVGDIKTNLITPVYTLVNENLGFLAFAVGGAATFLARGQDMYQKAMAFGLGALGTAGSVKLAQSVLHLG